MVQQSSSQHIYSYTNIEIISHLEEVSYELNHLLA